MDNKDSRQYLCLKCMKFWFVKELEKTYYHVPMCGDDDRTEAIPMSCCPECKGVVHYCGSHENRGDSHLFGERIAHLRYIALKVLANPVKAIEEFGIFDFDLQKLEYLKDG